MQVAVSHGVGIKARIGNADGPIFKQVPRIKRFRRDLIKAGVAPVDALGAQGRVPFTTAHVWNEFSPWWRCHVIMRHSDRRLTDKIYTDESLLGTAAAIDSLPTHLSEPSQIASQKLGASG